MPNLVNRAITSEYEQTFGGDLDTLVVQPVGLTVAEVNDFRAQLGEVGLRMRLVKGSLARRILVERGLSELDALFDGPAAFIVPETDQDVETPAIAASRVLDAWYKQTKGELPAIKGGVMDGGVLDPAQAKGLAKLPTKADVLARVSSQITGPGASLSSQLLAGGKAIAGAVKTHIENLEEAGS